MPKLTCTLNGVTGTLYAAPRATIAAQNDCGVIAAGQPVRTRTGRMQWMKVMTVLATTARGEHVAGITFFSLS